MMQSYLRAPLKKNFPLKKMAMVFSHGGLAITILGMVLTTVLETEFLVSLKEGESTQLAGHILTLTRMTPHEGPNYRAQRALLTSDCGPLVPEKRFYWTQKIIHNETSIRSTLFHHLYVALGEHYDNNSWGFRIYHKPWINLIWMGIILMVCGGLLGIYRRRAGLMTILMGAFLWAPAHALEVHEALPLKVLEIRAKALGDQLICPTCAGQSLNDSAADEAQLLREIIRQKILKGESDQQIIQWFVERYGNRVLFKPPLTPLTYLLWGFPWMLLGGGGVYVMGRVFRSGSQSANLNT
jgi:cytochrome c-type biogenesis protein CcmH/NrfF